MWDEKDQRNARKAFKKTEKKLIQEVREGKHDDFIDLPFITRKCLESGLVEVGENFVVEGNEIEVVGEIGG